MILLREQAQRFFFDGEESAWEKSINYAKFENWSNDVATIFKAINFLNNNLQSSFDILSSFEYRSIEDLFSLFFWGKDLLLRLQIQHPLGDPCCVIFIFVDKMFYVNELLACLLCKKEKNIFLFHSKRNFESMKHCVRINDMHKLMRFSYKQIWWR